MGNEIALLGATEIREIASRLELRPAKSMGQNFVIDGNSCQKIVRVAGVTSDDLVLEIGPGLGSLSLAILQAGAKLVAVEIDNRLANELANTLRSHNCVADTFTVINKDALAVDELGEFPTKLVANLPYNISVPVLLHILAKFPSITSGVVMVQTEVAERLAAKSGSKIYGIPSAKAAWWADLTSAGTVSRSIFWPVPNVDSSLVRFVRHESAGDEELRRATFRIIDAAFAQRRKMLRSALSSLYGSSAAAEAILIKAGIDPILRGEALQVESFCKIAAVAPDIF